jgi:YihY family inner membrane protein
VANENPVGNPVERLVRAIDGFQQRHRLTAFPFAVVKKFGDDRGGQLAALFAYYGFLGLFPLLLLLTMALGVLLHHDQPLQQRILESALAEFPIIGEQIGANLHALGARGTGLVVGVAGLLWGSLGLAQIGQHAMAQVWNVPGVERPNFVVRLLRSALLLGVLALGVLLGTGAATVGGHAPSSGPLRIAAFGLTMTSNVALFVLAFRVLTPPAIPFRHLLPGAVLAGVGWSLLQSVGGYLVAHQLRHAGDLYGLFGLVLGLLSFLSLGGALSVYAAEVNVVAVRHLWPRSLVQPPLTPGDRQVLSDIAEQENRRPEQTVRVGFVDERAVAADDGTDPHARSPF